MRTSFGKTKIGKLPSVSERGATISSLTNPLTSESFDRREARKPPRRPSSPNATTWSCSEHLPSLGGHNASISCRNRTPPIRLPTQVNMAPRLFSFSFVAVLFGTAMVLIFSTYYDTMLLLTVQQQDQHKGRRSESAGAVRVTTDAAAPRSNTRAPSGVPAQDILWNLTDHTENLFFVEDICHSSQRWFYRTDPSKRQPKVLLTMFEQEVRGLESPYPAQYRFEHRSDNLTQHCVDSPISDHVSGEITMITFTRIDASKV